MKKSFFLFFILLLTTSLFFSCASNPYSRWESSGEKVIELVNSGGDKALAAITASPFLFDKEIIILENDISAIWRNIYTAGFRFEDISELESVEILEDQYILFGDTMEVKTWFEKYLPKKPSLLKIRSEKGLFYIILGEKVRVKGSETGGVSGSYPAIYGFTGPVER